MPSHTALIGPPGTGKTTAGTTIAKGWFKSGLGPEDVGYLAFTKAAAHEAGRRMFDGGSASDIQKKLPYFRTIHSLAYRSLMKDKPDVRLMTAVDMKSFAIKTGFEGTYMVQEWEDLSEVYMRLENKGRTHWDQALTAYTLSRISSRSVKDLEEARHQMSRTARRQMDLLPEVIYTSFVQKYERFKEQEGLVDFTDMLEYALKEMRPLDVKKVVIDECLPAGSRISMADGSRKAIEDVQVDDQVLGWDHHTDQYVPARVVERRTRTANKLMVVDDQLVLTPNHPVFVIGKGYVEARYLRAGDRLVAAEMRGLRSGEDSSLQAVQSPAESSAKASKDLLPKVHGDSETFGNAQGVFDLPEMRETFSGLSLSGFPKALLPPLCGQGKTKVEGDIQLRDLRTKDPTELSGKEALFSKMCWTFAECKPSREHHLRRVWNPLQQATISCLQKGVPAEVLLSCMYGPIQIAPDSYHMRMVRYGKDSSASLQGSRKDSKVLFHSMRTSPGTHEDKVPEGHSYQMASSCVRSLRGENLAHRKAEPRQETAFLQPEMRWIRQVLEARNPETFSASPSQKPHARSGRAGEGARQAEGEGPCAASSGRQWPGAYGTAEATPGKTRESVASGVGDGDRGNSWVEMGETRSRESARQTGRGMRWEDPSDFEAEGNRSSQGACLNQDGMGHDAFLESGDQGGNGSRCEIHTVRSVKTFRVDVPVYNIGTETENYFAEGLLVHNCQDLAPALFSVVDRIFQNAEEIFWAGDEDQTIFSFAAADASLFIDRVRRANRRIFLKQTYRFGQEVVDFSAKIIRRVRERVPKEVWGLPGRSHKIRITGDFKPIVAPMLILHRHVMGCQSIAQLYMQEGLPFRNERGKDPLGAKVRVGAFETLLELASGRRVSPGSLHRLVDELIPSTYVNPDTKESVRLIVHGGKKRLQEGLGKEPISLGELVSKKIFTEKGSDLVREKSFDVLKHSFDLMYYQRVRDNGHSLDAKNVPHICTLHGAKGREAPMVVLFTETGKRCWADEDGEHRLAYVGATRTQGELEICQERAVDWADHPYPYPEPDPVPEPVPEENPFA